MANVSRPIAVASTLADFAGGERPEPGCAVETPSCTHSTSTADASRGFRKRGPFVRLEALAAIEGSAAFVKMAQTGRASDRPVPPRVTIAPAICRKVQASSPSPDGTVEDWLLAEKQIDSDLCA